MFPNNISRISNFFTKYSTKNNTDRLKSAANFYYATFDLFYLLPDQKVVVKEGVSLGAPGRKLFPIDGS